MLELVGALVVVGLTVYMLSKKKTKFLDKSRQKLTVTSVFQVSPDTKRIRFGLPPQKTLGLPIGKHFKVFCPNKEGKDGLWNGRDDPEKGDQEIERKYTPTTSDDDPFVDLVVSFWLIF